MCKDSTSGFEGFSTLTVNIQYVTEKTFRTLSKNVKLVVSHDSFSGGIKTSVGTKLLEEQHPEIFAKIPIVKINGQKYQRGLCFETLTIQEI